MTDSPNNPPVDVDVEGHHNQITSLKTEDSHQPTGKESLSNTGPITAESEVTMTDSPLVDHQDKVITSTEAGQSQDVISTNTPSNLTSTPTATADNTTDARSSFDIQNEQQRSRAPSPETPLKLSSDIEIPLSESTSHNQAQQNASTKSMASDHKRKVSGTQNHANTDWSDSSADDAPLKKKNKELGGMGGTPAQGPFNSPLNRGYFGNYRPMSPAQPSMMSTPQNLSHGHPMALQQMMGGRSLGSVFTNNTSLQNPLPVANALAGHYQVPQFGVPINKYHQSPLRNPAARTLALGFAPGAAMQENQANRSRSNSVSSDSPSAGRGRGRSSSNTHSATFQSKNAMRAQLSRKEEQILALQNAINGKDQLLGAYQSEINHKNGIIGAFHTEINAKNQTIGTLQSELKEKEQRIQILSRDLEISELNRHLAVYAEEKEIHELRRGLEARATETKSEGEGETEHKMEQTGGVLHGGTSGGDITDGTAKGSLDEKSKDL